MVLEPLNPAFVSPVKFQLADSCGLPPLTLDPKMAVRISQSGTLSSLSLTPLIDIVFLLLIFFLVATRFAEEDRELDVELPTASEAQPLTVKPKEVFVNVDQEGSYYVGGHMLDADGVEAVLQQAVVNNPASQSVIIRADRTVEFQAVVTVMNLCNKVGVADYKLSTANKVE